MSHGLWKRALVLLLGGLTLAATPEWWTPLCYEAWEWIAPTTPERVIPVPNTPSPTKSSLSVTSPAPVVSSLPSTPTTPEPALPPKDLTIIGGPLAKALTIVPPTPTVPPTPVLDHTAAKVKKKRPDFKIVGFTRGRNRAVILDFRGEQHAYRLLETIPAWGTLVAITGQSIQIRTEDDDLDTITYHPTTDLDTPGSDQPESGTPDPNMAPPSAPPQPTNP